MNSFWLVLEVLGLVWLRSGWEKLSGGKFVDSLAGTLQKFAAGNPYPWFKDFLINTALPNAHLLGLLVQYGEFLGGMVLAVGSLTLLLGKKNRTIKLLMLFSLLGLVLLNGIFWLATGYTSPSTDDVNLIMFLIEVIGLLTLLKELI